MYTITLTNNYIYDVKADTGEVAKKNGGKIVLKDWGSHLIHIPGMGAMNCIDLGDHKIPGYPLNENWGALFRYVNTEIYYRYEGGGQVEMEINRYGCVTVRTNFSSIIISLDELSLEDSKP